jgi:2-amino-4-hydroxy-6-hydroxymethyldihydropteridine diphosphokinase
MARKSRSSDTPALKKSDPAPIEAFISLGANLGDREESLLQALLLIATGDIRLDRISSIYETEPVGREDQPDFLNMVAEVHASMPPPALLARLLQIETKLGRVRLERWGARIIDLDLLCYGLYRSQDDTLILPHPRLHERRFVLVPFAEIAPHYHVGGGKATVMELLQACRDPHTVRIYSSAKNMQRRMRKA